MAKLKHLFKDVTVGRAIEIWKTLSSDDVMRKKSGRKERFVLIQNRFSATFYLFENLKKAGFNGESVRPHLIKILGVCCPPNPKGWEKKGWIKNGTIDLVNNFNEVFGETVDFKDVMDQALTRGLKAMFIPPVKKEEPEFEDNAQPVKEENYPKIYIPKGDKVVFEGEENTDLLSQLGIAGE